MVAVFSLTGKSGIGKTTFLEKLIPELRRRGHKRHQEALAIRP